MSLRYGLALHTSSPDLGLAIADFDQDCRQEVWHLGREQSNVLHDYLAKFMKPQTWTDLAFLAVAIGPGGFTGTRIGVVLARTLAQQLNLPLFGVSSLAAIAYGHQTSDDRAIAVQMPAQRGQWFTAIYSPQDFLNPMQFDTVMSEEQWHHTMAALNQPYDLVFGESAQGQYVSGVLAIAHQQWQTKAQSEWSSVLPFYGQHPVEQ